MTQARRFLSEVLAADLKQDILYRPGAPRAAWTEGADVLFACPLIRQVAHVDDTLERIDPGEAEGEVFLRLRAYGDHILRLTLARAPAPPSDDSPMLLLHPSLTPAPLSLHLKEDGWQVFRETAGLPQEVAWVDHADLAPHLAADGSTWLNFMRQDHFFPSVWDALPLYFLQRAGVPDLHCGFALHLHPGEHLCGTGERFDRLDLFGRAIDLINLDALGVNSQRAYKNVPFLLSSCPYGLFVHTHAPLRLDLGAHSTRSLQCVIEEDTLDLFFIGGTGPAEILYNYRRLTGFPPMPPVWSFGAWMSRSSYHSEEEVVSIAGRLRAEGYPTDVIGLDTGWFDRDWIGDWRFSRERFPDPREFCERLAARGFRLSLWQYPYIHRESIWAEEALRDGRVGAETRCEGAHGWGYTLDFTRPETAPWYGQKLLAPLLAMGVATIIADFGEEVDEGAAYAALRGRDYHNLFALLYQAAAWRAVQSVYGMGNVVLWARSAWAGSQRYPIHWAGDSAATFDGMTGTLCGGLHLGLSGFAFWSHDVGGFHGSPDFSQSPPSDRLYLRWTQMGVFSSHLRFHGTTPREPWAFPAVSDSVREWLRLRYALLPYIIEQAKNCTRSGLPLLRALPIDWPQDPFAWQISDQYMFGDALMVCPVLHDGTARGVYLPAGDWVDFWSGEHLTGPLYLPYVDLPPARLPLYARHGSRVVCAEPVQHTAQLDQAQRFTLIFDHAYRGFDQSELARWVCL